MHNALVPMTHSLEAPGGPLKYCLDGHDFAVFGCSLTTDQRYVISTSTRYGLLIRSLEDFVAEVNWKLRETRVTSRQGRQTTLSFLCDKIL